MNDTLIDFSSLDPKRSRSRFEHMVKAVMAGLDLPPEPWTQSLERELVRRAPKAVLLALMVAVIPWIPSLTQKPVQSDAVVAKSDPVEVITAWAQTDSVPANPDEVRSVLGDFHER